MAEAAAAADKEKKKIAAEETKAICALLVPRKSAISGEEEELTRAVAARELSSTVATLGEALALVMAEVSPLPRLALLDALEATFAPGSKAWQWFKVLKVQWIADKVGVDKLFARVSEGLLKKFAEGSPSGWLQKILSAKLEDGESPSQLADRLKVFNINKISRAPLQPPGPAS